jgi:two-component system response regulator HydG
MRVLVVDDEPNLRKVCQRLIASMGHECDTADNAAETLRAVADRSYDLILCDYRLATETADAVVETLARIDPNLITKVVIATGATTDPGVIELTQRHQMRLIAKPYGVEEIAEVLACIEHQSSSAA